jgi:hypothetical protein
MPREFILKAYFVKIHGIEVRACAHCGQQLSLGDIVVKTCSNAYHKTCFEKLLN